MTVETHDLIEDGKTKSSHFRAELHFRYAPGELDTLPFQRVEADIDAVIAREQDLAAAHTVTLGQSRAQVEAVLGKPETVLDLGAKVVYVYRSLKVVFVDGKVSDVQ